MFFASGNGIFAFRNVYFEEIGLSGSQMGVIGAAMVGAGMLAQPVWGLFADRYGRTKTALAVGGVVSGVAALLFPIGDTVAFTFVVLLLAGILFSSFRSPIMPIANAMVLETGLDYGHVRAFGSIAFGLGVLGLGLVISTLGLPVIFYLYVVGMAVFVFLLWGLPTPDVDVSPDIRRDALRLVKNRRYLLLLLLAVLVGGASSAGSAFFSVYVKAIGASNSFTGFAWLLKTVAEAVVFLSMARIGTTYRRQLLIGVVGYGLTFAVYGATSFLPAIAAVQLLLGVGYALFNLSAVNLAHRFAPDTLASTGQALLTGFGLGAGRALGQLGAGGLVDLVGVQTMYFFLAGLAGVGLLVSLGFFLPSLSSRPTDVEVS